jgi:predicted protein tyrosine phosphatase
MFVYRAATHDLRARTPLILHGYLGVGRGAGSWVYVNAEQHQDDQFDENLSRLRALKELIEDLSVLGGDMRRRIDDGLYYLELLMK